MTLAFARAGIDEFPLNRDSLSPSWIAKCLKRASVPSLVTDDEYKQLISLLESTLELDAKGRVRAVPPRVRVGHGRGHTVGSEARGGS